MKDETNFKEERFDSYLNKTIVLSSKLYFKRQMNFVSKENTIVDNKNFSNFLQGFINVDNPFVTFDEIELGIELKNALNSLSDIEQAVIFLLFNQELSQDEAAEILNIWSKSISRIKVRAIEKLRKYMEGDCKNEE